MEDNVDDNNDIVVVVVEEEIIKKYQKLHTNTWEKDFVHYARTKLRADTTTAKWYFIWLARANHFFFFFILSTVTNTNKHTYVEKKSEMKKDTHTHQENAAEFASSEHNLEKYSTATP